MTKEIIVVNEPIETDEGCLESSGGGGGEEIVVSTNALVRPNLVFIDSFDAGKLQSMGRYDNDSIGPTYFDGISNVSALEYHATGGKNNKGYVKGLAITSLGIVSPDPVGTKPAPGSTFVIDNRNLWTDLAGQASFQIWGGMFFSLNLFGLSMSNQSFITNIGKVQLAIESDLTIRAYRRDGSFPFTYVPLGNATTFKVPSTGWFTIEVQYGMTQQGDDGLGTNLFLYEKSGFVLANLYTDTTPPGGVPIVDAIGVSTINAPGGNVADYRFSEISVFIPKAGVGLSDWGIYDDRGNITRFLGNIYVDAAWPFANGDTIGSTASFFKSVDLGVPPQAVQPITITLGDTVNNYKNVLNGSGLNGSERLITETLFESFHVGSISRFTSAWLSGPFQTPVVDPLSPYNKFQNAPDSYKIKLSANKMAKLESVGVFALAGFREVRGFYDDTFGVNTQLWNLYGPHVATPFGADEVVSWAQLAYKTGIKSGLVTQDSRYGFGSADGWRNIGTNYSTAPALLLNFDPATGLTWKIDTEIQLIITPIGSQYFTEIGLPIAAQYVQFDVVQCGVEIAYSKDNISLIRTVNSSPFASLHIFVDDLTDGNITVYDASNDFNGGSGALISGIITRTIDWGDGSSITTLIGSGTGHTALHHYTLHGTYNATLTVTNTLGLINKDIKTFVVPVGTLTALFSTGVNPADVTGFTIDFTDISTCTNGIIVAWDWDFGDGSGHSTVQNPGHDYTAAGPGPYTITLIVTDDLGRTATVNHTITVPILPDPRIVMAPLFFDSMGAGLHQSSFRYDFVSGSQAIVASGGRDGKDGIKEGDTFGTWQYTFAKTNPLAFQFCFDLAGQALPAKEVPLFVIGFQAVTFVLRPDGKVRGYAWDGAAWQNVLETAAAVPGTGIVRGTARIRFGAAGAGFVKLRINGETLSADPVAVNPGQTTMLGDTITFGTGSGGNFNYAPVGGFSAGLPNTVWCDIGCFDDSVASTNDQYPGDVHCDVCLPQAIGSFNDSGGSAANAQSADEATTANTFTVTNQKDTFTVNTPGGTLATILAVMPFYEGFRGGVLGTRTFAMLLKSGATLAQSANISSSSSWTSRFFVTPADTLDRWILTQDPNTLAAWTNAAAIGATEVGMLAVAINAGGTLIYSQVGLEVAYWDI